MFARLYVVKRRICVLRITAAVRVLLIIKQICLSLDFSSNRVMCYDIGFS